MLKQKFEILEINDYICRNFKLMDFTPALLNISDIRDYLAKHPEPPEIEEIRQTIICAFSDLEFIEGAHRYFIPRDGKKKELQSVSSFVSKFIPYVDWEAKATVTAKKNNMKVEDVKRMWEETNILATNNGTSTHLYGESLLYFCLDRLDKISPVIQPQLEKGYLIPYSSKQMAALAFYKDILKTDNIYPVLAETRVYVDGTKGVKIHSEGFAGTFDMLFAYKTKKGQWKLIIGDFKTNKSLYNTYAQEHDVKMLYPYHGLTDEAINHYAVQLSAYQLAIEQLGYIVGDRKIIWLKEDGTYEKLTLPKLNIDL